MLYAAAAALLCWALRLLTWDGAIAAALVGGLIWEAGGLAFAATLLIFFVTSSLLNPVGSERKRAAGLQPHPRRALQVLANGGPAAICAMAFWHSREPRWAAALLASLAAANADTWATEVGVPFGRRFFRITNLQEARAGASGAVSVAGLVASFFGAAVVSAAAPLIGRTDLIGPLAVVGFAGSLLDSVLGDLAQATNVLDNPDTESTRLAAKRFPGFRWVTNDMVNLISVSSAAAAGYLLAS